MAEIQLINSPFRTGNRQFNNAKLVNQVAEFYRSVPFYQPTPLINLETYARENQIASMDIKDESQRFSEKLKAFKATGGLYAMAVCIAKRVGLSVDQLTYNQLQTPAVRKIADQITFYTATDGNHGRGVAWAAEQLGTHAVVKMPVGSTKTRADHIAAFNNTEVEITNKNYDDTVKLANEIANQDPHGILIQDMAWEGYTEIPQAISAGYSIIVTEILEQLASNDYPTHLFLQAGVGQLSAGIIDALFSLLPADKRPLVTIVEPATVACYYLSAQKADGDEHTVPGSPQTIMAGLNCQTPSLISFPIIRDTARFYGTLTDEVARQGMRILARPQGSDSKIISGESGVAAFAFVNAALQNEQLRQQLKLDSTSRVLVINTEGDTDEEVYQKIVNN
ncbi:diaminopropionate ammonia-lyase [Limosilactobacillus sp. STM2_1]|uniref:Diaminopropionate ammonia-lyase n=1 Tax=Limosilactobacillus rudii TaxID=2759755 RepID=A0A7W3UJA2_9LACO|nr:diaminopropionate ammonia-lyase [Limosilactobacillus rudii]MBB1078504.1 diaminopropionate ammonia-lyase [Limosilactobacillus rudii]MBB1096634.1 diaminopropionate ammonia-lyase [Limosilactobacillus rudii]MCD7134170.1 diaminopropionate ammonia-lyase [Limosilactobacillus rudii]